MKTLKLEIDISQNNMYCCEIYNNSKLADICKRVIANNLINTPDYIISQKARPFLQCNTPDYTLIEFWTSDFGAIEWFVDFINTLNNEE